MKKFLIFEKLSDNIYGKKIGSYESEFKDDTSANRSYLMAEPFASHFEILGGVDEEVLKPFLVGEKWVLQPEPELVLQKAIKTKESAVTRAYDTMNTEVLQRMFLTFGTQNPDSASAYERTWVMMSQLPSDWSDLGLKDDLGNDLDTAEKVLAFAQVKLAAVVVYGKYRMQRIAQFRLEKETIVAG